jgi:hypothetical protein
MIMKRFLPIPFALFVLAACGARTLTKMGSDDAAVTPDATTTAPMPTPGPTPTQPPPDPPNVQVNAVILNDCAPNDGPAFRLVAGSETLQCALGPNLTADEIIVWKSAPTKAAKFAVSVPSSGVARVCTKGMCVDAATATLEVTMVTQTLIIGTYQLPMKNPATMGRSFVAKKCNNSAMCG